MMMIRKKKKKNENEVGYEVEQDEDHSNYSNAKNTDDSTKRKVLKPTKASKGNNTEISQKFIDEYIDEKLNNNPKSFLIVLRKGNTKGFTFLNYLLKILKEFKNWNMTTVILSFAHDGVYFTSFIEFRFSVLYLKIPYDAIDPTTNTKLFYKFHFPDVENNKLKRYDLEINVKEFNKVMKVSPSTQLMVLRIKDLPGASTEILIDKFSSNFRMSFKFCASLVSKAVDINNTSKMLDGDNDHWKDIIKDQFENPSDGILTTWNFSSIDLLDIMKELEQLSTNIAMKIDDKKLFIQSFGTNQNTTSFSTSSCCCLKLDSPETMAQQDKNFLQKFSEKESDVWNNTSNTSIENLKKLGNGSEPYIFVNILVQGALKFATCLGSAETYLRLPVESQNKSPESQKQKRSKKDDNNNNNSGEEEEDDDDEELDGFWTAGAFLNTSSDNPCHFILIVSNMRPQTTIS